MRTILFFKQIARLIIGTIKNLYRNSFLPNIDSSSRVDYSVKVYNPNNLIMEEQTNIDGDAIIMNPRAKFVMKKWSGAAVGLLVVTGNHMSVVGKHLKQVTDIVKDEWDVNKRMDKDVIVDEDVWIGSRVTLLAGSHIGRGAEVGSNSVVRGTIPPYTIVVGNPAKIVGFRFTPDEIVEHEKSIYEVNDRLPLDLLEKNYQKYFMNRVGEIKNNLKL